MAVAARLEPIEPADPAAPRLTAGSLSSAAALLAAVASAAVTTPVILNALGARTYGVWVLLTVVGGYTQLADFGLAFAVSRFLGEHRARRDPSQIRAFLGSAVLLYGLIFIAVVVISTILGLAVPPLTGIPLAERTGFLAAAVLVGVATGLALWLAFFLNVFHAYQRLPLANLFRASYWILLVPASVWAARSGWGVEGLAGAMAGTTLVVCVISLVALRRAIPELSIGRPERGYLRNALTYGSAVFAMSASATIVFETSNLIIAGSLGVVAVAAYAVALRLTRTLSQFLHRVSDVLFPFYAGMRATGDLARMRHSFLLSARLEMAGAAAAALGLAFAGREVLRIWVGSANVLLASAFTLAVALVLVEAIAYPASVLATAAGGERSAASVSVAQAALNVVLALALAGRFGVTGVIAAAVLAQALTSLWWMPGWAIRFLGLSWRSYFASAVWPVLLSAVPGLLAGIATGLILHGPFASAAVALLTYGVIFTGVRAWRSA